jgi:dTDP-4-amino-4,6-dideoxygalactose transaminase
MNRISQQEIDAVLKVLRSQKLSGFYKNFLGGEQVQKYEQSFAEYHKAKHAVSTSSGTSALHTALLALGVGKGDKVVVPPLTFVSSVTSVLMCNAEPLFCDVDPSTYNLNISRLTEKRNIKAIMTVHLLGTPCNMDEVLDVADELGAYVIEDCAQAIGAKYKGKLVGTIGDIACFSTVHTKVITTGEGGMILTDNEELASRCRQIRNHGEYYGIGKTGWTSNLFGYNYRLTEIQAAIGIEQLKKLDMFLKIQKENAEWIIENLPEALTPPRIPSYADPIYYIIGCIYNKEKTEKSRDEIIKELTNVGVNKNVAGATVSKGYTQPLYKLPIFQKYAKHCPTAESLVQKFFWLDIHRWCPLSLVKTRMEAVRRAFQ